MKHTEDCVTPQLIDSLPRNPIKKIMSLTDATFLLYENGEVWGWGNSEYNQITFTKDGDKIVSTNRHNSNSNPKH